MDEVSEQGVCIDNASWPAVVHEPGKEMVEPWVD